MKLFKLSLPIFALALLASCNSSKTTLPYFVDLDENIEGVLPYQEYKAKIQPDDELMITVSSSTPTASLPYNFTLSNPGYGGETDVVQIVRQLPYRVDSKGYIAMPMLGDIYVEGMTVEQLQAKLTEMIRKDIKDATVKVELTNFYIHIAGEVMRPTRIVVNRNNYSILDAISEAGDLTQYGERSNILIVRTENGKRVYKHLDLNSSDIFNSPYFYLKQNDYIYVEPNNVKRSNARYDTNNAYRLQVIATIVSATSVIASLVIALVIK